ESSPSGFATHDRGTRGRVIDTAGDGILAEFSSVVNAVECAVAIQKVMMQRNADISLDRQMKFRIGVNLGDVICDDTRVYGDGVNVAARLESIAEPGSICVSGAGREQVQKKVQLTFVETHGPTTTPETVPAAIDAFAGARQLRDK